MNRRAKGLRFRATVLLAASALIACGDRSDPQPSTLSVTHADSAGVVIVEITGDPAELPVWSLADEPTTEIRGDTAPFIGSIGEVAVLSDGRLLLEDDQSKSLYLFRPDGTTFSVLGARGDGPGEFRDINALSLTAGDTVYAFDRRQRRMSVFDASGAFLRSIPLDTELDSEGELPRRAWALTSARLVAHVASPLEITDSPNLVQRDQRDVVLHSLDGAGSPVGSSLRFQGGYSIRGFVKDRGIIIVPPFANAPILASGNGQFVHGTGLEYELVVSGPDLTPMRVLRWPGWVEPLSDTVLAATRAKAAEGFSEIRATDPDAADLIVDVMFTKDLLPSTMPALGSALMDDRGRLWVSEFRPSPDRLNQRDAWHVLDGDGTPLARVRLPDRARLVAVRNDHVALVMLDDLDVEHLRVLRLRREGP